MLFVIVLSLVVVGIVVEAALAVRSRRRPVPPGRRSVRHVNPADADAHRWASAEAHTANAVRNLPTSGW